MCARTSRLGQQALRTAWLLNSTSRRTSCSLRLKECSRICSTSILTRTGFESSPQNGRNHANRSSDDTAWPLGMTQTGHAYTRCFPSSPNQIFRNLPKKNFGEATETNKINIHASFISRQIDDHYKDLQSAFCLAG